MGYPIVNEEAAAACDGEAEKLLEISRTLLRSMSERNRRLAHKLCPVDQNIQDFLDLYFADLEEKPTLPTKTLTLDRAGMARECSLPLNGLRFQNEYVDSYRVKQGVLHNPRSDRRTTKGSFHIVKGGLPVPPDKKEVPEIAFARLFESAMNPPRELLTLPFSMVEEGHPVETFVSLYMRPVVCPEVKNVISEKTMAVRFFAPGSLVSNLDFVESIFGNGGDPELAEHNPNLDVEHWSGHTGCIILAPHLTLLRKKDLGLPHVDQATERQKTEGMCWQNEDELYNDGEAFKLTCRDDRGVVITLIADNYFGYSKKEIKTQISYSANLLGLVEEEHAGGTLVFPRRGIQGTFFGDLFYQKFENPYTFQEIVRTYGDHLVYKEEGYAVDKRYASIIYIPENTFIDIYQGSVSWIKDGKTVSIKASPDHDYVYPSGHKLKMEKNHKTGNWQLISTQPEGVFCHKPATVSGGGKSEISKKLDNAIKYGSFHVQNLHKDFEEVERVAAYDFRNRWKNDERRTRPSRPIFSKKRSLGSVVKLLTPSGQYTNEYNEFLATIPYQVKSLILFIKMFYREEIHGDWRGHLTVDSVNGREGRDLKFNGRKITASYLRMGFAPDGSWYLHTLRSDFIPSAKIQMEDDITASIVMPTDQLTGLNPEFKNPSAKLVENCEARFFQRPDDAIHRGMDLDAERDLSSENLFITNFEPLTRVQAKEIMSSAIEFDQYSVDVQNSVKEFLNGEDEYLVVSSHPRIVDGSPTKNPRYLQTRHTDETAREEYLAEMGIRLARKLAPEAPIYYPVNAVLSSRRNNPAEPEKGIRPLSVYNPIHFQEIPELFMDFICSLTGKSPSTTGAGSEGALTKGPFNMLTPTTDLNNALISWILTGYEGFTTVAGYVGDNVRFDHDISIFIPEIWARLRENEKNSVKMIKEGSLEKLEDFEYEGKKVLASRLGYRITEVFLFNYFNRVFNEPQAVYNEDMLRPEKRNLAHFVDGINNIVEAQQKVALAYFEDGSIDSCIPPLRVLIHMMAHGHYEGKDMSDPELRKMFERDEVIQSDWYRERLVRKQEIDTDYYEKRISYLESYLEESSNQEVSERLNIHGRLEEAKRNLDRVRAPSYLASLYGSIGADILFRGKV